MRPQRATLATQIPATVDPAVRDVLQAIAQSVDQLVIGADLVQIASAFSTVINGGKVGRLDAVWLAGVVTSANVATVFNHKLGRQPSGAIEALTLQQQGSAQPVSIGSASLAVVKQTFIANGTYMPTPGMVSAILECVGAGGGGGGVAGNTGNSLSAGGGGGGGYTRAYVTAAQVGASQAVTVSGTGGAGGAGGGGGNAGTGGGATSIGALCDANGGGGGQGAIFTAVPGGGVGATAGTNGAVKATGAPGGSGYNFVLGGGATLGQVSGTGASGLFGGGGLGGNAGGGAAGNGNAGTGFGSGGGGGAVNNAALNAAGAAGAGGLAIATEFVFAATSPLQITKITNSQITLITGSSNRPFTLILF